MILIFYRILRNYQSVISTVQVEIIFKNVLISKDITNWKRFIDYTMIDELQWSRSFGFCAAECFPWPTSTDPLTRHSCWYSVLCFGPSSALVCGSEMITSPSRCVRSCSIAIFSCLYEPQCQIWTAAAIVKVANPLCLQQLRPCVTPSEVLLTQNMLLQHYPQRHGNDAANDTFIVLSARCGPRRCERRHPETHASPLCFKSFNRHNQACLSRLLAPCQPWAERDGAKRSNSVINGALLLHITAVTPPVSLDSCRAG